MTRKEMLKSIVEGSVVTAEMAEVAAAMIEAMEKENVKRVERAEKAKSDKMTERQPIIGALVNALTDEYQTASQLIEAAGLEIKPQAVSTYFRLYVEEGAFEKGEVKAKNAAGKTVKMVGYKRA